MSPRQRRLRRRQRRGRGAKRGILVVFGMVVIGAFAGAVGVIGYIIAVASSAPDIQSLKPVDQGANSVVYASNGRRLGFIENDELRQPVSTRDLPPMLRNATVAVEDQRFYKHQGVDYEGVIRAAVKNLRSGATVQGGSTITMQLVRNIYPITKRRTFERKIREAKLAQEIEQQHTKSWVLTNYLNSVPYGTVGGRTAIGAEAAARVFFAKRARDLNLAEAATLAGLPQAPSLYNPFRDPRAALARRNDVLQRMRAQGMIDEASYRQAAASPLGAHVNDYYFSKRESYFFDYVKEQLIERYGLETVRKGGLKIYTTIDLDKQQAARDAMAGQLNYQDDPSSAIVTIDPKTGYIRAMASSTSYKKVKYNYAAQGRRQAGSTFKVMVLMAALRKGVNPRSTFYTSRPLDLQTPYGPWKVSTYAHTYGGSMNLITATTQSDNTVYAQLILDIGPDAVKQAAKDMGITSHLDGYPAEGLGGLRLGVSPLEMANAYATIAAGGIRHKPLAVRKVVFPDGKSEDVGKPKGTRTFSEGVAWEATQILERNVQAGTGTKAQIGCPAAGKTGTVDEYTDAWFIGFTPKLTTAVWVGYPNQKVPMYSVHGIRVAGGTFPAMIWHDYMAKVGTGDCSSFQAPSTSADFQPFFGKYAGTGSSGDTNYGNGNSNRNGNTPKGNNGTGTGTTGGGGGGGYNPNLYETQPQRAPQVSPPSRGGGGGRGNGGGGNGGGNSAGGTAPGQ
ncbi:MAG: penicillin-binding protein [Solirubrobacteraceae bacterium]|jgi:penicillin-binding protein 1A|nr:penicillin-binding protein [Solirubrobacteraceae bacterium]